MARNAPIFGGFGYIALVYNIFELSGKTALHKVVDWPLIEPLY
jgi:hypothetical protein